MVRHWPYGAAAVLVVIGAARALFLLWFRRPVVARTCGTDLTEMQRLYDGDMHRYAMCDGLPTPDDIPVRRVLARVAYEIDGIEHRADVCLITHKGDRADDRPVVWYDPFNPNHVTGVGLGPATTLVFIGGAVASIGYHCPF